MRRNRTTDPNPPRTDLGRYRTPMARAARAADNGLAVRDPFDRPQKPGSQLGPYVIESLLGSGGMGAVYRVRHGATGAPAALKVLKADDSNASARLQRFQREAEVLARIDAHENVVRVHAVGLTGATAWCAMDLVEGASLAGRLESGVPITARDAAALLAAVADGIAHVHRHDVVHRDLKPDNVIIDARTGAPRIVDFGIAYDAFAESLTRTGAVLGTPAFMAPEQLGWSKEAATAVRPGGRPGDDDRPGARLDVRTDVYGLGATLYAVLTGRPPFIGETPLVVLAKVMRAPPDSPRAIVAAIPPPLEAICLQALEKDPADRYATASAFGEDLRRFLSGERVLASTASSWSSVLPRFLRPRSRIGRTAFAAIAASLAVAVTAIGVLVSGGSLLATSPGVRLDAAAAALGRGDPLPAGERAWLDELAVRTPGEEDGPREAARAIRARCLVQLDRVLSDPTDSAATLELAASVRAGGRIDRRSFRDALDALHASRRLDAIDALLHDADPVEPAPLEVAGALAAAMATDGPGGLRPPIDRTAFKALLRAPRISSDDKARLRIRRAERLIESGPERYPDALDELTDAFRNGEVPIAGAAWPDAFVHHAQRRFADLTAEAAPEIEALGAMLIRATGGDVTMPGDVVAVLQRHGGALHAAGVEVSESIPVWKFLAAGSFLEAHGMSPYKNTKRGALPGGITVERILEKAREELARTPTRRNPAVLVFAALSVEAERPEEAERLIRAAGATNVPSVWLRARYAEWLLSKQPDAENRFSRETYQAFLEAVERDAAVRPADRRWAWIPHRMAEVHVFAAGGPDPDLHDLFAAARRAIEAADAVLAGQNDWFDELEAHGAVVPWALGRTRIYCASLYDISERLVEQTICCGEGPGIDEAAEACARLLATPRLRAELGPSKATRYEARMRGARGRHAVRHGRLDEGLAELTRSIELELHYPDDDDEPGKRANWHLRLHALHTDHAKVLRALDRAEEAIEADAAAAREARSYEATRPADWPERFPD